MTYCKIPAAIEEYLQLIENGTYRFSPEQKALGMLIRKSFARDDIFVNEAQLANYLGLQKYFPFALFPWEKFLLALWDCIYWRESGRPRWKTVFAMLGRGAGKDGFIAYDSFCSVSPYNPVSHYDVDICANNEEQAVRPVEDLVEVLDLPESKAKLAWHFYHTKQAVRGRKNRGTMRGRTNNPKGRDGMRSGKIIMNEVHQYGDYNNIKVFTTGLGKVGQPRIGFFTSNGEVSDGPLDDYLQRGRRILFDGEPDKGFLPFICCLAKTEDVHDAANWTMANPSLPYLPDLLAETQEEYQEWCEHPEQNGDFLTKRMGIRSSFGNLQVTNYENIKATNRERPDVWGLPCTVGIDYAGLNDWAAVNLHFLLGEKRVDINHAWVCMRGADVHRLRIPLERWIADGHITPVDDVQIPARMIAEYIQQMGQKCDIRGVALDNYRYQLMAGALAAVGFDPKERRNLKLVSPRDIMKIEPVVQQCFDLGHFCWGEQPHLRWAVNNTKRCRNGYKTGIDTGNFYYAKIEPHARKTDPFMALVASMTMESLLENTVQVVDLQETLPAIVL